MFIINCRAISPVYTDSKLLREEQEGTRLPYIFYSYMCMWLGERDIINSPQL